MPGRGLFLRPANASRRLAARFERLRHS